MHGRTSKDALGVDGAEGWRRNLWVCVAGSFTTLIGMTLLLPFLPIYVEHLGAHGAFDVAWWSGVSYAVTFLAAAIVAPLWGRLGDRYGRKQTLLRASLGMAVAISLTGLARNVGELVALRSLTGLLGGYASGATILIAGGTPRDRSAWALGVLASGSMAGGLLGPLVGGLLPPLIGIRATFMLSGGLILAAFAATALLIVEDKAGVRRPLGSRAQPEDVDRPIVARMLAAGSLLTFANFSIEPVLTIYVGSLVADRGHVITFAGVVMAAAALGSILAAPRVGRLTDRLGPRRVIVTGLLAASVLMALQAMVATEWQLLALRFLMGVALGGLLPSISSVIRSSVPDRSLGTVLGLSTSAQYAGQVAGPLMGGFVGGMYGPRAVFLATSVVMAGGAMLVLTTRLRRSRRNGAD